MFMKHDFVLWRKIPSTHPLLLPLPLLRLPLGFGMTLVIVTSCPFFRVVVISVVILAGILVPDEVAVVVVGVSTITTIEVV